MEALYLLVQWADVLIAGSFFIGHTRSKVKDYLCMKFRYSPRLWYWYGFKPIKSSSLMMKYCWKVLTLPY